MDARRKRRLIVLGAGILLFAIGLSLAWRYTPLREMITIENVVGFIDDSSGKWWTPIVLALVYTPASVIMFPRPLLTLMEPSVQKFTRDFGRRVAEPDGPAHIYGSLPTTPVAATDGAAKGGTP